MAVASRRLRADIVSAEAFPELARRYAVKSVPTTIVNDESTIAGAPPEIGLVSLITKNPD